MGEDFRQFVMRGNVVDLAVGVIIGAAFGAIVTSLVNDILMPPIGLAIGGVDFSSLFVVLKAGAVPPPYPTLDTARAAGAVTLNLGVFLTVVINFFLVASAVFLVVRAVARLQRQQAPASPPPSARACPHCCSAVAVRATRCPHCTSALAAG
jgi:large conductance mechanosensitive channel